MIPQRTFALRYNRIATAVVLVVTLLLASQAVAQDRIMISSVNLEVAGDDTVTVTTNGSLQLFGSVGGAGTFPFINGWGYSSGDAEWRDTNNNTVARINSSSGVQVPSAGRICNGNGPSPLNGSVRLSGNTTLGAALRAMFGTGSGFSYSSIIASGGGITYGVSGTVNIAAVGPPQVDIQLSKMESIDPVVAGSGNGNLTYVVTATNGGPANATGVTITESLSLPAGVTVSSVTPSAGGVTGTSPSYTWNLGSLTSGASATLTVVLTVSSSTASGTNVISDTATLTAVNETDTNTGNDSATLSTSVARQVDLVVSKTESIDPVVAGSGAGNLTYVVTVSNSGPSDATGVTISESLSLPAGVSTDSVTPSTGTWSSPTWSLGTLTAGSNATLTVVLTADSSTAAGTDVISDLASVAAVNETDTDAGNDSASASTSVTATTDVTADKVVSGDTFAGGTVTYVVTLTNAGPADAVDDPATDEFTDTLPPELVLVDAVVSLGGGTVTTAGNTVTWNGPIPAGGAVELEITATVAAAAFSGTPVTNQGTIAYDQDGDGINEATRPTDDPSVPGAGDATTFVTSQVPGIPTIGSWGTALLVFLLAACGALLAMRARVA